MSHIHYESWLVPRLVNNNFPWDQATPTTFPELLRCVTFHDGSWYGCFMVPDTSSCLLVLQPDAFWNQEFCHRQESWPYVIIEVSRVLNISCDLKPEPMTPIIVGFESAPIDAARFTEWLEFAQVYDLMPTDFFNQQKPQPPLHRTDIDLLPHGILSFIHEAPVRLLLYSETGELLPVQLPEAR